MLKSATIAVVVALAAGCAGQARPVDPTDLAVRDDVVAAEGENGVATEIPPADVPATVSRADLEPVPLPDGVRPDDFDISLQYNRRIAFWLGYYQKYHATFGTWLGRMSRYEPLIRHELTAAGLPGDLVYLALIESGFAPNATSSARAVGIWQFMKETARLEGLEVSTYIDERRDPVRATAAAVHHLRSLYRELGSWYLVAAAYNSGSGRVARALDASAGGARGADSLFWSIEPLLPQETRDYVPQFLAASILAKFPDRFGVTPDSLPGPDDYVNVRISQATDLAAIARAARVPDDVVRRLNPQFYLGVTPPGRTVSVRVPAGSADGLRARLAAMPRRQRVHDLRHTVAAGETPKAVAHLYGIELAALRRANHLKKATRVLAEGRVLVIPLVPASVLARSGGDGTTVASKSKERPGGAADVAGVSREAVRGRRAAEGPDDDAVRQPAADPLARSAGRTYRVKPGDTLSKIAQANGVSLADLLAVNSLRREAVIRPGQQLRLARRPSVADVNDASRVEKVAAADARRPEEKAVAARGRHVERPAAHTYRVRAGDTLWQIARQHGLSVKQLCELNDMEADATLRPGQTLRVGGG